MIFEQIAAGRLEFVSSVVVEDEAGFIPQDEKRLRVLELLQNATETLPLSDEAVLRGSELERLGFSPFDALHLAVAECARVSLFLSTDDKLVKRASRLEGAIRVTVKNPLYWIMERSEYD